MLAVSCIQRKEKVPDFFEKYNFPQSNRCFATTIPLASTFYLPWFCKFSLKFVQSSFLNSLLDVKKVLKGDQKGNPSPKNTAQNKPF
jgi:hypothetical protein